jgi:hypothetical protein
MEKIEYYETAATRNMHALPRFGNTNNFSYLFGTEEQRSEYIYGLLFAGVFIYAWFIAWCAILLIFKCLRGKVGFLSGRPMRVSHGSKKPMVIRIIFVLSVGVLVTFSGLLVTQGLTQLKSGIGTVYASSVEFNGILANVEEFSKSLDEVAKVVQPLREEVVSQLSGDVFCPGVDLNSVTGVDLNSIANKAATSLDGVENFTLPQATVFQETLDTAQETSDKVETTSENITPKDWQALMFVVPFSIFAFLYLVGVALVWLDRNVTWYICILSWVVLPLFTILIIICFLCSGAIAIGASANADFCSGGTDNTPGGTITEIMALNGFSTEDIVFQVVEYYIQQCVTTNPLGIILDYEVELEQVNATVTELQRAIQKVTLDRLAAVCGEGIRTTASLVQELATRLARLVAASLGVVNSLACERIVPLYTTTFYSGTCNYSVQGVTWTFASFLVIAVFGMLMITFRTAYMPVEDADLYKLNGEEGPLGSEAVEVEYNPSKALPFNESNAEESYGFDDHATTVDDTGATVVTAGVAAAGAASYDSSSVQGEDRSQPFDGSVQQGDSSQQSLPQQDDPSLYDDQTWLETPVPVGAQY